MKFSRPTTSTAAIKYSRVLADYKHTLLWQRKLPTCTTSTSCPLVNVSPGFRVLTDCMTTTTRSRGSRARLEVPRPTMTHHHHQPTPPPPSTPTSTHHSTPPYTPHSTHPPSTPPLHHPRPCGTDRPALISEFLRLQAVAPLAEPAPSDVIFWLTSSCTASGSRPSCWFRRSERANARRAGISGDGTCCYRIWRWRPGTAAAAWLCTASCTNLCSSPAPGPWSRRRASGRNPGRSWRRW